MERCEADPGSQALLDQPVLAHLATVAGDGSPHVAPVWPDIGALLLIVFLVPAMFWFHPLWKMPEDQQQTQSQLFFRNVTLRSQTRSFDSGVRCWPAPRCGRRAGPGPR